MLQVCDNMQACVIGGTFHAWKCSTQLFVGATSTICLFTCLDSTVTCSPAAHCKDQYQQTPAVWPALQQANCANCKTILQTDSSTRLAPSAAAGCVQAPQLDEAIITCRGQQVGVCSVPAHAVDICGMRLRHTAQQLPRSMAAMLHCCCCR